MSLSDLISEYMKTKPKFVRVEYCPLCMYSSFEVVSDEDRYGFNALFSRCQSCGFVFMNPTMDVKTSKAFYELGWYRRFVREYRGDDAIDGMEENQRAYGMNVGAFISENAPLEDSANVLDFGGSTGVSTRGIINALACSGTTCDARLIEQSDAEAERARGLGFRVYSSPEDCSGFNPDLLLVCRTIDHIQDPVDVMQYLINTKRPKYVYIDAVDFPSGAKIDKKWLHIDHPSNFTRQNLSKMMRGYLGMKIIASFDVPGSSCYGYLCGG